MNFLKNLFKSQPTPQPELKAENNTNKALDDLFVENFIAKGGRFLYCQTTNDLTDNLTNILNQEQWVKPLSFSNKLVNLMQSINVACSNNDVLSSDCFFTNCEHLIAEDGSVLFSSKQLKDHKINNLPKNFIVFAKTSQLVHNKGESLTGIKNRYQKNEIPSNITPIKNYKPNETSDDFMLYGNSNAKQLYLLLLEDL
jgi:L-lactate utilization protein LutC